MPPKLDWGEVMGADPDKLPDKEVEMFYNMLSEVLSMCSKNRLSAF